MTNKFVWFTSLQGKTGNVTTIVTNRKLVDNNSQVIQYWKCDETLTFNLVERYPDDPVARKYISNNDQRQKTEFLDLPLGWGRWLGNPESAKSLTASSPHSPKTVNQYIGTTFRGNRRQLPACNDTGICLQLHKLNNPSKSVHSSEAKNLIAIC